MTGVSRTRPLAMAPMDAGLTNQKLALLGLAIAARDGGRAIVPPPIVDYRPGSPDRPLRPFATIFDEGAFAAALGAFGVAVSDGVASGEGAAGCDPWPLFDAASTAIVAARRGAATDAFDALCRLLAGLRPAPALLATIDRAVAWLDACGVDTLCQMRIERDWRRHVARRLAPEIGDREDLFVAPAAILAKLAATPGCPAGALYIACNEEDLAEDEPGGDREAIRAAARAAGHEAWFLGDVLAAIGEPLTGSVMRTTLDAGIGRAMARAIGHSRSSFFNMLALSRHGAGAGKGEGAGAGAGAGAGDFWLYNGKAPRLKRRTDRGAYSRPWLAAHG